MSSFINRVMQASLDRSPLVLGVDPDLRLASEEWLETHGASSDIKLVLTGLAREAIEACIEFVCAVKFQAAYYERFGLRGMAALSESISHARALGLEVILDAKRGDIGTTSNAYAEAYLSPSINICGGVSIDSDFQSDAITVNPFMGWETLSPFVRLAKEHGSGIFVLTKTSNPGSQDFMDRRVEGRTTSESIAAKLDELGADVVDECGWSNVGAVVGATHPDVARELRKLAPRTPFLMPGVGVQGGSIRELEAVRGERGLGILVPISRALMYPQKNEIERKGYAAAVRDAAAAYATELNRRA